jgi:glycosyltransferase involved in cell wall biosynthesis
VATAQETAAALPAGTRTAVTVVIPCFNEELILPYLANTLRSVLTELAPYYDLTFLFVDDASTDGTWAALQQIFGDRPECRLVRHEQNRGVAGAIATGLQAATTEVVASIDCDCTYDPHTLREMIPLLGPDTDLVTASPYHPSGAVRNVPEWRLSLSWTLSRLYRLVLHHKLFTYTSCFRVYRRSAALQVPVTDTGFLGVAEFLGRLDLMGGRIVEFPTTLQVRMMGRSKMKIIHTILGHLGLIARLVGSRLFGRTSRLVPSVPAAAPHRSVTHV